MGIKATKYIMAVHVVLIIFSKAATVVIVGVTVLQLYASDPDRGVNGSITFSLVQQSSLFRVSADGRITTRAQGSSFDRETQDTYSLMVRASDGGSPPKTGILQILLMLTCLLLF